jgi:hypothetical protein
VPSLVMNLKASQKAYGKYPHISRVILATGVGVPFINPWHL